MVFTGDWSLPVKEAEAANSLADQGVDVLTMHVDSPKVIVETAEKRGIFSSGYHANQAALAPKGYLTGAEWNWAKIYTDYVTWVRDNKTYPHLLRGGLKEGFVKLSPYGPAVSDAARAKADEAKARLTEGTLTIFKGPIKSNTGKVVDPGRQRAGPDRHRAREDGLPGRGRGRQDPLLVRPAGPPMARFSARVAAVLVSLLLFGAFVAAAGANVGEVYYQMYRGAFGTWFSFQNTLQRAAPADAHRPVHGPPGPLRVDRHRWRGGAGAGRPGGGGRRPGRCPERRPLWCSPPWPWPACWSAACGSAWPVPCAPCAGVNETLSSLLLNYIAIALFNHLVEGPLRDPASLNKPSTQPIGDANALGSLPGMDVH